VRVGILGAGQLGRMLALAAYPFGFRFRFYDPSPYAPAGQLAEQVAGTYDDTERLLEFADGLDVITYEFENVPVEAATLLSRHVPVYPPPQALEVSQDRITEKGLFGRLGIPVPAYVAVNSREELDYAVDRVGLPAVLKTTRWGYDGKGQAILRTPGDVEAAWSTLGGRALILEGFVGFDRELSLLSVRGRTGETTFYPLVENHHREGILRKTIAPAPDVSSGLQERAQGYASRILEELDYLGVLALELFQKGDELLANEMAPRVHNSGHWSIEGAETSQFENHLRAIAGLPLGSTVLRGQSVMLNLIGSLPPLEEVLSVPGAHLHLYAKEPRPGRKVGHITVRSDDPTDLPQRMEAVTKIIAASGG
jgi:5-(carboxyamino)imidazole ribonucleotide synthase